MTKRTTDDLISAAKTATDAASALMDEAMQRQGRELISAPTIEAGDLVYRVVEYDPPELGALHTWMIESREVKRASGKQITLKSYFPGDFRIQFPPNAIERGFFFPKEQIAIDAFAAQQRSKIESLKRQIKDAERALLWAYDQGAPVIP